MRKTTAESCAGHTLRAPGWIISAVVLLSCVRAASAWTDRDYAACDYRGFADLPAARARLDMGRIDQPLLNAALFYETNRERAAHGKPAFRHSPVLERAAQEHSADMARLNFMSHDSPIREKRTLKDRITREGGHLGGGTTWGENIGMIFGIEYASGAKVYPPNDDFPYFRYRPEGEPLQNRTYLGVAREAVREWMASPGHRSNILSDKFQELGTGSAHYTDPQFFGMDMFKVTQDFSGTKAPSPAKR